jgi:hypothetical protein
MYWKQFTGLLIVILILTFPFIGCGDEKLESQWIHSGVIVDGNADDWSDYPVKYFDKDGMEFIIGVVNNDSILNVMIRLRDQRMARMLEHRGVTFWINKEGKKEKQFGILYKNPVTQAVAPFPPDGPPGSPPPNQNFDASYKPRGEFSLLETDTLKIPPEGLKGIQGKTGVKESIYCYEIMVPLKKIGVSLNGNGTAGSKRSLGIEVAGVSEEEKARMKEMMAEKADRGRPGGGMGGGRPAAGMRGSGDGPPDGKLAGMPNMDGKELWFTVILATR